MWSNNINVNDFIQMTTVIRVNLTVASNGLTLTTLNVVARVMMIVGKQKRGKFNPVLASASELTNATWALNDGKS